MSNLTIFNFENSTIQTIVENNEVFFRAAQLAELLQYSNPHKAIKDHVDPDDLTKREIVNTVNKRAQVWFVNESGMYALILGSKLESAKKVKRWITSEVLPQIRRTGRYEQQQLALPEPEPKRERKVMLEMTEEEACDFCWLWFSHKMQNQLLNKLIEPLQAIKSEFHSQVYSHSFEYKAFYRAMFEIVDSLAETFKDSTDSNWVRIREHIIEYRLNQRPILFRSRLDF